MSEQVQLRKTLDIEPVDLKVYLMLLISKFRTQKLISLLLLIQAIGASLLKAKYRQSFLVILNDFFSASLPAYH